MLIVDVLVFAHLTWLGLYLIGRGLRKSDLGSVVVLNLVLAYAAAVDALSRVTDDRGSNIAGDNVLILPLLFLIFTGAEYLMSRKWVEGWRAYAGITLVGFAVGAALVLTGAGDVLQQTWSMLVLALVAMGLGLAVAAGDARKRGEPLLPDVLRSYDYSLIFALLFGGQIVLAMLWSTGTTPAMVALLLGTITAAIAVQVFIDPVQDTLDRIAFARFPWLREERTALRHAASALPRAGLTNPLEMDEETFARLTRRALSNYGDLTRLAGSPLVNLPEIYRRLEGDGAPTTVERAAELKLLLAEAIEALKPRTGEEFGTTDEWRFYNALYFPYVVGMRPYSLRAANEFDDSTIKWALSWFQAYVPERTLHNWQNAAAALVAQYLREQEQAAITRPEPVAGNVH